MVQVHLEVHHALGFFYTKKGHQIFTVNLCDKRGNHGVKNTVDLIDLQNTLDWS